MHSGMNFRQNREDTTPPPPPPPLLLCLSFLGVLFQTLTASLAFYVWQSFSLLCLSMHNNSHTILFPNFYFLRTLLSSPLPILSCLSAPFVSSTFLPWNNTLLQHVAICLPCSTSPHMLYKRISSNLRYFGSIDRNAVRQLRTDDLLSVRAAGRSRAKGKAHLQDADVTFSLLFDVIAPCQRWAAVINAWACSLQHTK